MGRENAAPWHELGMDREPVRALEGQHGKIEEARTCIPGLSDTNRPASHGGFRAD
jgi:hypothetical protein